MNTPAAIADTRAVFEPLYGHPLTEDEVVGLLLNFGNLLRLLCKDEDENGKRE
jgi:hypothetical protein